MARAKIYYAEAQIVWARQYDRNCSFLLVFSKETASLIAKDFFTLATEEEKKQPEVKKRYVVPFEKSTQNDDEFTLFAKEWHTDAKRDKGTYKLKILIREGSEQYPKPEVVIQEKELVYGSQSDDDIMGTIDLTKQQNPQNPQPQQVNYQTSANDSVDFPF